MHPTVMLQARRMGSFSAWKQWHGSAVVALYLPARWKHFTVTAHLYRWRSGYARGQRDTGVSVRTQEELFSEHTAVCFTC